MIDVYGYDRKIYVYGYDRKIDSERVTLRRTRSGLSGEKVFLI